MFKDTKANKIFMIIVLLIIFIVVTGHKFSKNDRLTFNNLEVNKALIINAKSSVNIWIDDSLKEPKINYSGKAKNIEVKSNNGQTIIKEDDNKFFLFTINWEESDSSISVYLPSNYLPNLEISTISDDINFFDNMTIDEMNIDTVSGDINFLDIDNTKANINSVSGDIYLSRLDNNNAKIGSTSGEITIEQLNTNEGSIETISGDINILNTNIKNKFSLESTSGDILIKTNDLSNISYSSLSGDIEVKGEDVNKSEDASAKIKLTTTSGDIDII